MTFAGAAALAAAGGVLTGVAQRFTPTSGLPLLLTGMAAMTLPASAASVVSPSSPRTAGKRQLEPERRTHVRGRRRGHRTRPVVGVGIVHFGLTRAFHDQQTLRGHRWSPADREHALPSAGSLAPGPSGSSASGHPPHCTRRDRQRLGRRRPDSGARLMTAFGLAQG
ncbi:hypothetical protein [Streptomyces sp. NPDC096132]|uniref:hypothetical protein n=1 Tax=Streptomyces sp. NPDC096132 TaxID=3366075 RepID=UPI00382431D6